jgi:hypothetical protein
MASQDTDSLSQYARLATADESDYEVFAEEMVHQNKQWVYKLIKQDSIQPLEGSTLSSFYEASEHSAIDKLTEAELAIARFDISAATAANNSAPVANATEQKHQKANDLLLKYMNDRNYQFTDAEKADLYAMANECPVKGSYVSCSRNLINAMIRDVIIYEDNCDAELNNNRKANITDPVLQTSFNLFPNPNNGNMQLDYDLASYTNATMNLYDVAGKLLKTYKLENTKGTIQINEQNLHNGVYFYTILVNGKSIKNDKIIVIK